MSHKTETIGVIGVTAIVVISLIILGPLVVLWSLNTLFPALAIPYTIQTWFAIVFFSAFFKVRVGK